MSKEKLINEFKVFLNKPENLNEVTKRTERG